MNRDHLSADEIVTLKELRRSGMSRKYIARKMDISPHTISKYAPKTLKQRHVYDALQPRIRMNIGEWYEDTDGCMTRIIQCRSNG